MNHFLMLNKIKSKYLLHNYRILMRFKTSQENISNSRLTVPVDDAGIGEINGVIIKKKCHCSHRRKIAMSKKFQSMQRLYLFIVGLKYFQL